MNDGYRPSVPRKWLLTPVVILLIVVAALPLIKLTVPGADNIHGAGGLLLFAFALTVLIVGVIELFALAITVTALLHAPELRTAANLAAVAVAAAPFLALASWLIYERM